MGAMTVIQQPSYSMGDIERAAGAIARGGLFGSNDPNAVFTLLLVAQAEGKHPGLAFQQYHVINGKPAKKADAMLVDFLAAGGKVEWHALTDDIADATFSHPQGGSVRITWDGARVQQAGLGNNPMHKKYPRAMKRSRTVSEGVRTVFPGATSGMYVPEEMQDIEPAPRNITPTPPAQPLVEHQASAAPVKRKWPALIADVENLVREADTPEQLDDVLESDDMRKLSEHKYDEYERIQGMIAERRETMQVPA